MTLTELREVRRKAFRAVNQDGLMDAFLGLVMVLAGTWMFLDKFQDIELTGVPAILPILVMFGIRGLRKRYTYPRVGYANLKTRGTRLGAMIVVTAVIVALVLLFLLVRLTGSEVPRFVVRLFPALIGGGLAVWMVVLFRGGRFRRYLVYAATMLAALVVAYGLGLHTALVFIASMGACGLLMLATGVVTFARFLRAHPVLSEGSDVDA